jgi:protein-tyrosine phosphatase
MDYTKILDHLYIGSCPATAEDIEVLYQNGITAVLNLQTDEDEVYEKLDWPRLDASYRSHGIDFRRVPVRDFDPEDLAAKLPRCVSTLRELLDAGNTVYMHCTAGTGRAPTLAIAYLYWEGGMKRDEAYEHVRSRRRCSPTLQPSAMPRRPKTRSES